MAATPCVVSIELNRHMREEEERARRARTLQRLEDEEYDSMTIPEDMMQLVAEHVSPVVEAQIWQAYRAGDHAEIGRIVSLQLDVVRDDAANARAAKRMEQLESGSDFEPDEDYEP